MSSTGRLSGTLAWVCIATACTGGGGGGGAAPTGDGGVGSSGGDATTTSSSSSGGQAPVTLGPNLDTLTGTANTFGCAAGYPIQTNLTFPQPFYAQGAASCLVLTFLAPTTPSPGPGVAKTATIRVGPTTGPMRFVRMRILYNRTRPQECCSLEQYGTVFTPTANGPTTVTLDFPMTEDPVPAPSDLATIAANDLVALEVLGPNIPIPGVWTKDGGPELGTASFMWLPALSDQKVAAPSGQLLAYTGSYSGFVPSFTIGYVPN